jgi:hypothetical protein
MWSPCSTQSDRIDLAPLTLQGPRRAKAQRLAHGGPAGIGKQPSSAGRLRQRQQAHLPLQHRRRNAAVG